MLLTSPRGGQTEALRAARQHEGFLVFAEQRVGKTWISLARVDDIKPRKLLIACRKNGVRVWHSEIAKHLKIDWDMEVTIITHESLNRFGAKEIRGWMKKARDRDTTMVIVDECHKIKKRGTRFSRTIRQIAKCYARYRIGLSGTPMGKGVWDFWPQMDLVDPTVFGTFETFGANFIKFGGFRGLKPIGVNNFEEFVELLESRSFRITMQEARGENRYKVCVRKRTYRMPGRVRAMYQRLEKGLEVAVGRSRVKPKAVLHSAQKCHQLTGGFLIEGTEDEDGNARKVIHRVHDGKLELLRSVLAENLGRKQVVIAKYTHEITAIRRLCREEKLRAKVVRGGSPYDGKFNVDVVILQIQSGDSIDLSEAAIAIFYSADYSFIINAQVRSRILSFSTDIAIYYYLMAEDSVDEDIYEIFRYNKKLADVILDRRRRRAA